MSGVPRITEIYALVIQRITGFFAILPKDTNSPRGRENTSVTTNICTVTIIPSNSWGSMAAISANQFIVCSIN